MPGQQLAQPRRAGGTRDGSHAPLADAVRFVDRDEADAAAARAGRGSCRRRRRPAVPATHTAAGTGLREDRATTDAFVSEVEGAVVERRGNAVADERIHLVLHQRDQRRHDHREAGLDDGGRLEAQRLAPAGRQHDDRVATRQDRFHRLALQRAERGITPVAFERLGQRWNQLRQPGTCRVSYVNGTSGESRAVSFGECVRLVLRTRRVPHRSVAAGRARADHACARRSRAARQYRVSLRRAVRGAAPAAARRGHADRERRRTAPHARSATCASASTRPDTCSVRRRSASNRADGVWVVAGDYKRAADPTCAPFEPVALRHVHHGIDLRPADLSLGRHRTSSSTTSPGGGSGMRESGRTSLLFCYTLGQGAAAAGRADAR